MTKRIFLVPFHSLSQSVWFRQVFSFFRYRIRHASPYKMQHACKLLTIRSYQACNSIILCDILFEDRYTRLSFTLFSVYCHGSSCPFTLNCYKINILKLTINYLNECFCIRRNSQLIKLHNTVTPSPLPSYATSKMIL